MKAQALTHNGATTFALVFDHGDSVVSTLVDFAAAEGLTGAHLTAIGAFSEATLGFFDWQRKEYDEISIREQVEVLSLVGDIALGPEGDPQLHAHAVLGGADGAARGGHLVEARVRPTLEVVLTETPSHLRRRVDPESGLPLIAL